jgi:arginase
MQLTIITSPFSLDEPRCRGGLGPDALLAGGLVETLRADGHDVALAERGLDLGVGDARSRIGRNGAILADLVAATRAAGRVPLVLGGDCLVAIGIVAGIKRSSGGPLALAYFDAHGDFNTPETSPSGYLPGMPLACVCGRGLEDLRLAAGLLDPVAEADVSLLGVRDLDPPERAVLDTTPVRRFEPDQLETFAPLAFPTYLHIDLDTLDPSLAPGVTHPAPGGLAPQQVVGTARRVPRELAAIAVTTLVPERDDGQRTQRSALEIVRGALAGA